MPTWDDVVRIGLALPGTEESTSYGTPALKVRGKTFVRVRDARDGVIVVMCSLEEKEALLRTNNPALFTTSHYDGYGAILAKLGLIDMSLLRDLLEEAWWQKAPLKIRAQKPALETE